jgi:hypothetical protein
MLEFWDFLNDDSLRVARFQWNSFQREDMAPLRQISDPQASINVSIKPEAVVVRKYSIADPVAHLDQANWKENREESPKSDQEFLRYITGELYELLINYLGLEAPGLSGPP